VIAVLIAIESTCGTAGDPHQCNARRWREELQKSFSFCASFALTFAASPLECVDYERN
jgi:hypothetical protein